MLGKILVISPHLDDAVFSCGESIAKNPGALVATVFSSAPASYEQLTEWDAASGFLSADEAVSARKQEDYAALHLLCAQPLWLDFPDSQYNATPSVVTLSAALHEVVQTNNPETILFPAGLFHSDHLLVHRAMLAIRQNHIEKNWIMYEDALYRRISGALQKRLANLLQAEIEATPVISGSNDVAHLKEQAVHCYGSQLTALAKTVRDGIADAFAPERLWRLTSATANKFNEGADA